MKFATGLAIIAVSALLAAAPNSAEAQAGAVSSSVFNDFLKKGKGEIDNFEYGAAMNTWNQLLGLGLSKQQRIDVLQLVAATLYPNDPEQQKRDSAAKVIQQLVGTMGIRRMVVKDVTHPGLDSLYASVVASTPGGAVVVDSVRDVVALVNEGYSADDIVYRVTIDCYTFAFDELELALRQRRMNTLSPSLKRTCSQVFVESDPPNGNLTLGARDFGNVPEAGLTRWVAPERSIEIAVAKGQSRSAKTIDIPQGRQVQARFFLPKDTLLWPATKTSLEIAQDLRIFDNFRPSTPQPVAPVRPGGMGAFATGMLWGLVGGAAGFAAGQFLPAAGCTVNETVPAGQTWRDPRNGKTYNAGETMNLGGGMGCSAMVAGGGFGGMFLFTSIIKGSKNRGAQARYAEAQRTYPATLKTWEDTERRRFADNHPDVRQAMADQQIKLSQTQSENGQIRARNQNLPQPEINIRDLNLTGAASPAQAGSAVGDVSSDVDLRVPQAAAPNADAVAVVIGNRDYRGGVARVDNAVRDALSMRRYLVEAFGFDQDRVILDTNVSVGRMNELFGSASDATGRLAELVSAKPAGTVDVFVFYSGHGAPEGRPAKRYLVPVDGNPRRLGATGYALDVLYKNLTALKARSVTVAIDAGFGTLASAASTQNQSFGGNIELEVGTVGGPNAQVFLAGTGEQSARVRRDQGHGLFTYFLLKGVQGSADANGDRNITAGELEAYVKANVRTYAADRMLGAQQVPEVFTSNPSRVVVTSRN